MIFLDASAKGTLLAMVYFTGSPLPVTVNQHLFHLISPVLSITEKVGEFMDKKRRQTTLDGPFGNQTSGLFAISRLDLLCYAKQS